MNKLPDEIIRIIKKFVIFKPTTKEELQSAVDLWCRDRKEGLTKYGHISLWDTSLIVDISSLFFNKYDFNDDISQWDVSNVTDMHQMFENASVFNQPIGNWDVSSVFTMYGMFENAGAFNRPLDNWDVSSVTDMQYMFWDACVFKQCLENWDMQQVEYGMFEIFHDIDIQKQCMPQLDY